VTNIWVPGFDLLNQHQGVQGFRNKQATIYSDGSVKWIRTGPITAMCQYKGLAAIPFDTLGCQFIFGGAGADANLIAYKFIDEENVLTGQFDMIYSEYLPVKTKFEKGYTWYYNVDHASALFYNFYFTRAQAHYVANLVLPTIILTYVSFLVFLLDMRVGERIGFGMALALVVVAQQIVTISLIPVSNQNLWIDKFISWSFYWVIFGLVQSVLIGFLYYVREDHEAKTVGRRLEGMSAESREDVMETAETNDGSNSDSSSNTKERASTKERAKKWFYSCRLRKFDYFCLVLMLISYTVYIIVMFSTNANGTWARNEPTWSTAGTQYKLTSYNNSNPNE